MGRFAGSSVLGMIGYEILDLGTFFVFGSVMAALGFEKLKHRWLFLISILVLVLSIHYNFFNAVKHVVLPVIVLIIGFAPLPFFSAFGKIGDMSYGIYIYSFPVQQTLIYYYNLNLDQLMFWSLVISITLGYLSWHLIEKKALSFKNKPILKSKLFNKVI
jgi:peptidoglycan/LPS O-acetylase OafA/YrhL